MNEASSQDKEFQKELAYYKKQLDQFSGESIKHDFLVSSLRRELNQKKAGFSVLSNLQSEFSIDTPLNTIFGKTVKAIATQLNMDRSVILIPVVQNNFKVSNWYGYPQDQTSSLEAVEIKIPLEFRTAGKFILRNKSTKPDETLSAIQRMLGITYFTGVPVLLNDQPIAFIISGRQHEKIPFIPPLDKGDAETLTAIASLISTISKDKNIIELKLQKAEVEKQKDAISEQRDKLEQALSDLQKTQALLIQREKMASLGELTAGIAHEIQNPLNFVNNFSEINVELIDELEEEFNKQNYEDVKLITKDLKENEQKINHHGKRADAIVKGMLEHSRASTGKKEPTEINKLADEYIRLSYHGIRAKEKEFNATLHTDFDISIGKINVVPQDIGRVLLNLFNNAFYAIGERRKVEGEGYEPTVIVSTKKVDGKIEIRVKDNGVGIPEKVIDKIYQPFFTTKPTGQGTGLGLSLSYDIIKAHGGEIKVEIPPAGWAGKECEGSEFIVTLPV